METALGRNLGPRHRPCEWYKLDPIQGLVLESVSLDLVDRSGLVPFKDKDELRRDVRGLDKEKRGQ